MTIRDNTPPGAPGSARSAPREGHGEARPAAKRPVDPRRSRRGGVAQAGGVDAEGLACAALEREGWTILGRRLRTEAGEVDAVAQLNGLLAFVEVKSRPTLADAARALSPRQRARLLAAGAILLAENPGWGASGVRFDVLAVDAAGQIRRIADAFRLEG